jgi:hypothetical protein
MGLGETRRRLAEKRARAHRERAATHILWRAAGADLSHRHDAAIASGVSDSSWDTFVHDAESHGIAPLAYAALERHASSVPVDVMRALRALRIRHRRVSASRVAALTELTCAFAEARIPLLVLKGAALAHTLYEDPALRPTRDVDVLTRATDVVRAVACLVGLGYRIAGDEEWHHAAPVSKTVLGEVVTIEVHRSLGIEDLRTGQEVFGQDYDALAARAAPITGVPFSASSLGAEDALWHVLRHGFMRRLFDDRPRLVSLADTVHIVETWLDRIDWDEVRRRDHGLLPALAMLHHMIPWSPRVLRTLNLAPGRPPRRVGDCFYGWPRHGRAKSGTAALVLATLWPAEWWMHLRHGTAPGPLGLARSAAAHWREVAIEITARRHLATSW